MSKTSWADGLGANGATAAPRPTPKPDQPTTAPRAPQKPAQTTSADYVPCKLSPGKRPGFVDVHFSEKPPEDVRDSLKAAGFRWSRYHRCWYGPDATLPQELR